MNDACISIYIILWYLNREFSTGASGGVPGEVYSKKQRLCLDNIVFIIQINAWISLYIIVL